MGNSGIKECMDFSRITPNLVFLQFWGMWGKTAINPFVMLSGYFMCTSNLTPNRFAKIYLQRWFYRVSIFLIFLITGNSILTVKGVIRFCFPWFSSAGNGFIASFLLFYLFIPYYNKLIQAIDERQHAILCIIMLGFYCVGSTIFLNTKLFSEPVWYMILYFVAAYIRLYEKEWMRNNRVVGTLMGVSIAAACASVLAFDLVLGKSVGLGGTYFLVGDSNRLLAFVVGTLVFLFFKNLKIPHNKMINSIAASTFGVLLIHTHSDEMRIWLWNDFLKVTKMYEAAFPVLVIHAVLSAVGIFAIGVLIDKLRIRFVEKPVFNRLNKIKWVNDPLY